MAKIQLAGGMQIDARSRHSQVKMLSALQRLHDQGVPFSSLKVGEFCRLAGVSRATFYRHHQDLKDILAVELLKQIGAFEHRVDQSTIKDFQSGSALIVSALLEARPLWQLIIWASAADRAQDLMIGAVQRVLITRDYPAQDRTFISGWLGAALLRFALQTATTEPALPQPKALSLYRMLIPDLPPIVD
ncbi:MULTISPECIES: hypothetical protein [Lacticaseibacillus]|uniref:HTH tetR-type domain-containing protein n=1 Tax=Lacticaseibacillus hegangensis TaxID=2486010 RepID=A0ABW4CWR5_9LACO|nr:MULTISPECIES: hypothetical protein [Lacticaseibacillus]